MGCLFRHILLRTAKLQEMRRFYRDVLGFRLVLDDESGFSFDAGETVVRFEAMEHLSPIYHFAFNIPKNKIEEAHAWMQERTPIVPGPHGVAIYPFSDWNAYAFYFLDPDGNILELIARQTLDNSSDRPFDTDSIQCVSELGVVTKDVVMASQMLMQKTGVKIYPPRNTMLNEDFQALGDENGLFVVVRKGRTWLGSELQAEAFPASVTLDSIEREFELADTLLKVN